MVNAGGIAIGPDGSSYVVDSGNSQVDVFSASGTFGRSVGKASDEAKGCTKDDEHCTDVTWGKAGILRNPTDVVVDSAGNIYVTSAGNDRVDVFSPDGTFMRAFGDGVNATVGSATPDVCTAATGCKRGSASGAPEALSVPGGLEIDVAGNLYVADSGNDKVDVFSPAGAYVRSLGKDVTPGGHSDKDGQNPELEEAGSLNHPDDVAIGPTGQVAVTDASNRRIDVFAADGTFVRAFGAGVGPAGAGVCTTASGCTAGASSPAAGGFASLAAIALSPAGTLYVADTGNNRIDEFGFDGSFVRAFGLGVVDGKASFEVCTTASGCKAGVSSTAPGAISAPRGTTVDCHGGIYAVEVSTDEKTAPSAVRVERFGEEGIVSPPCLPGSTELPPTEVPAGPVADAFIPSPPLKRSHTVMKPKIEIELNNGSGTAVLIVTVADPGMLVLKGKDIRTVKKRAKGAGLFELLLQVRGKALKKLEETGKVIVKASLAFKPEEGPSITQGKAVALKMVARF